MMWIGIGRIWLYTNLRFVNNDFYTNLRFANGGFYTNLRFVLLQR